MSDPQADFIKTQYAFTAHIRDPDKNQVPDGIEDRRMKIYRELFYNNIEGFISSAFPVLKEIYSDDHWHKMVRDFFIRHRCQTPYFLEISEEFLSYLQNSRMSQPEDPAFLLELAHYEWVELALMISEENIDMQGIDANGDLLSSHPVLSPLAWSLAYQYPVHKIGPDYLPDTLPDAPSYLVVYRNRNDKVEFMEVNPVTARLLQLLIEHESMTGQQALEQIATELQTTDLQLIVNAGLDAMQQLQKEGIILGSKTGQ